MSEKSKIEEKGKIFRRRSHSYVEERFFLMTKILDFAAICNKKRFSEWTHISIISTDIDYKTAAAILEGAHYAYTFIRKANILSGQRILINGATGGIGSSLSQFARQSDVKITATCNTKNIDLI